MQITQVYLDNVPGPDQAGLAELELSPRRALALFGLHV